MFLAPGILYRSWPSILLRPFERCCFYPHSKSAGPQAVSFDAKGGGAVNLYSVYPPQQHFVNGAFVMPSSNSSATQHSWVSE